ncbi:hypothetical protein CDAR_67742 [Caerostris darwini]|uniref:Uncharacterized protein n=1 Tax=Caerostris darwini TaxID=1538125 RepID=A0AAV4TEB5_9ARAC|nr:hypothetical protein CDAR_67742 [Caerostris darwini]
MIKKESLDCSCLRETFFDQVDISKLSTFVLEQCYFNYLYWTSCRVNLIIEKKYAKTMKLSNRKSEGSVYGTFCFEGSCDNYSY